MKALRPILDGEFKVIQLDDNPTQLVMIWVNLPIGVNRGLIELLKVNANLYVLTSNEMSDIDLSVACHELNINYGSQYVLYGRRQLSLEKVEVTMQMVQGLSGSNFIYKLRYT